MNAYVSPLNQMAYKHFHASKHSISMSEYKDVLSQAAENYLRLAKNEFLLLPWTE
jgi:hypothetical protein